MHIKKRRQRHSKRRAGGQNSLLSLPSSRSSRSRSSRSRSSRSRLSRSSSQCHQKIMDAFKQYNTFQYRTGLETVVRELSKYHPLAIIEFIELYYNEKAALAYFNNDKCVEMMLDKFKRQLHKYKATLGQAKTTYPRFTIEDAELIINKGYDAFTKVKLRGGRTRRLRGGDEVCPICWELLTEPGMDNFMGVIKPDGCQHKGHATCLRDWWRRNPSCPICRQPSTLPAPLEGEPLPAPLPEPDEYPLIFDGVSDPSNLLYYRERNTRRRRRREPMRALPMRAFMSGLLGIAMYNLDRVMEIAMEVGMDVGMEEPIAFIQLFFILIASFVIWY